MSHGLPSLCPYRLPGRSKGTQARGNHHEKARPGDVSGMGSLVSSATLLLSSCDLKKVIGFLWVGVLIRKIRRLNWIIPKAPSLSNILQFSVRRTESGQIEKHSNGCSSEFIESPILMEWAHSDKQSPPPPQPVKTEVWKDYGVRIKGECDNPKVI